MSEENNPEILKRAKRDVEMLDYDYMKHISTLSLVTLGGALSLAQSKSDINENRMVIAIVLIAFAGAFALAGLESIIHAKHKGQPLGWSFRLIRTIAIYSFGIGIGIFLALFLDFFQT